MKVSNKKILSVPTNVISGFLGAGKTSAILHLLTQKPKNERWAILVNEFGEIGIDGDLFNGLLDNTNNVFIKEVLTSSESVNLESASAADKRTLLFESFCMLSLIHI